MICWFIFQWWWFAGSHSSDDDLMIAGSHSSDDDFMICWFTFQWWWSDDCWFTFQWWWFHDLLVHIPVVMIWWFAGSHSSDDPEHLEELEQQRASLLREKEAFKVRSVWLRWLSVETNRQHHTMNQNEGCVTPFKFTAFWVCVMVAVQIMVIFWVFKQCSKDLLWYFRGMYYLHVQGDQNCIRWMLK
jgi:hypothetical protein